MSKNEDDNVTQHQMSNRNSLSDQKMMNQTSGFECSKRWLTKVFICIVLGGTFIVSFWGYREPKITVSPLSFKVQHPWSISVPITEIASADTILWKDMPPITLRTNGISLLGVNRGSFKTKDGSVVRLSVKCGISPVIRIVEKNGKTYYVNRKNSKETQDIFVTLIGCFRN